MTDADPIPHVIRSMQPADRAFVVETTLKVRQPRGITWREWEGLRRVETESMADVGTVLVVEAGGVLLGFAVAAGGVLHMLYVKRDFRGDGLGLEMLRRLLLNRDVLSTGDDVHVDHPTASWRAWARRRGVAWRQPDERKAAA